MTSTHSAAAASHDPLEFAGQQFPAVVRTRGLRRDFGRVRAVDGLDMTVRRGEIYGFLGRNGAGKTTTIRMLMGIISADEGGIELFGEVVRRVSIRHKRLIGYVSQEQFYYPWMTCRQLGDFVSGFYPSWDRGEFERLLKAMELPPDRQTSQLSGGMRVKLALALALSPRPELLILDEPTAGLDPVARREFLDLIEAQARNHQRTTFFSTHLVNEVERIAGKVGIIDRGRMLFEGAVADLSGSFREIRTREAFPLPSPEEGGGESVTVSLPEGFRVVRSKSEGGVCAVIAEAAPEAWESFSPSGAEVARMPLEDIFIALVGKTHTDI